MIRFDLPCRMAALAALALIGGCGAEPVQQTRAPDDPVVAAALSDQLMVDPALAGQNPRNAALTGGGPATAPIPPEDRSAETIAAARAEALHLAGGAIVRAGKAVGTAPGAGETALEAAAAALGGDAAARSCVGKLGYGFIWAARMPAAVPIYPRGHVQEAAGSDLAACTVRAVNFRSAVAPAEIVDFYWTRARSAGLSPVHRMAGETHVISAGGKGGFTAWVRSRDGLAEVDLVTTGG